MVQYNHRFAEYFVIGEIGRAGSQTAEEIGKRLVSLHGEGFNSYLEGLEGQFGREHREEIALLDSMDGRRQMKEGLAAALRSHGILDSGTAAQVMMEKLMGTDIIFSFSGCGKQRADEIECDFVQIHKYCTDFPERGYSFPVLAHGVVFHELGHSLRTISGVQRFRYAANGKRDYIEESFAQGVSALAAGFLGMDDHLTDYYRMKAAEIGSLGGDIRGMASKALVAAANEASSGGLAMMGRRLAPIGRIYMKGYGAIEKYANPLNPEDISERVQAVLG